MASHGQGCPNYCAAWAWVHENRLDAIGSPLRISESSVAAWFGLPTVHRDKALIRGRSRDELSKALHQCIHDIIAYFVLFNLYTLNEDVEIFLVGGNVTHQHIGRPRWELGHPRWTLVTFTRFSSDKPRRQANESDMKLVTLTFQMCNPLTFIRLRNLAKSEK